jgi:hypothetical protein
MGMGMTVTWQPGDANQMVGTSRVFTAYWNDTQQKWGPFEEQAEVPAGTYQATLTLKDAAPGQRVWVSVQPSSVNGARREPGTSGGVVVELSARARRPEPPTNFTAHMEGDKIVFTWNPPSDATGLRYEIRHGTREDQMGGWVLAQVVGNTAELQLGPTSWFATCAGVPNIGDEKDLMTYMLRAVNRHGVYSDIVEVRYGARIANLEVLKSTNYWLTYASQGWHDYGDGWKTDSLPPLYDPNLFNLTRHADGYLTYSGSNLVGIYTTADMPTADVAGFFERESQMRFEAAVFAVSRNPDVIGEGAQNTDGTFNRETIPVKTQITYPYGGNVTLEGNLQGEVPTLKVQMKLIRDGQNGELISTDQDSGGNDGWIDFKPGYYTCHGAQFRVVVRRPSSDWDVRIYRFWTQTARRLPERHYRTPSERYLAQELDLG